MTMDFDAPTRQKIEELQLLEHSLQSIAVEKQTLQVSLNEVLNALGEVRENNDEMYRVIGSIMLRADKKKLLEELSERQKVLELRIGSIEKQEKTLEEKSAKLRSEITKAVSAKKSDSVGK